MSATSFSLLLPAIEYGESFFGGEILAVAVVIFGLLSGAVALHLLNRFAPHEHFISDEIIPETHRRGYETLATFSLMGGFGVMMFMDATLG